MGLFNIKNIQALTQKMRQEIDKILTKHHLGSLESITKRPNQTEVNAVPVTIAWLIKRFLDFVDRELEKHPIEISLNNLMKIAIGIGSSNQIIPMVFDKIGLAKVVADLPRGSFTHSLLSEIQGYCTESVDFLDKQLQEFTDTITDLLHADVNPSVGPETAKIYNLRALIPTCPISMRDYYAYYASQLGALRIQYAKAKAEQGDSFNEHQWITEKVLEISKACRTTCERERDRWISDNPNLKKALEQFIEILRLYAPISVDIEDFLKDLPTYCDGLLMTPSTQGGHPAVRAAVTSLLN